MCGLHKKYGEGIFEKYVDSFDFVGLSETKTDSFSYSIDGYNCLHLEKKSIHLPYGGYHGIALLFKEKYSPFVEQLENTNSDCVLWVKIDNIVLGMEFIMGVVYIPHEGSKYYSNDLFEVLAHDCLDLQVRYELPFLLIDDWNSRTGLLFDFIDVEYHLRNECGLADMVAETCDSRSELEEIGICTHRYNEDKVTNNNGYRMIELCQSIGVNILNGRFGKDLGIGKTTCDNKSTIDYAVASPAIMSCVKNLEVDVFDKLLSDKHNPIIVSLLARNKDFSDKNAAPNKNAAERSVPQVFVKTKWCNENRQQYCDSFNVVDINALIDIVSNIEVRDMTQERMDDFANQLCNFYILPAKSINMIKEVKTNTKQGKKIRVNHKPWFGKENEKLRKDYFK